MTDEGSIAHAFLVDGSLSSATSSSRHGERDSGHFYLSDVMDLRQLR
jgi:hypothetical protein